MEYPQRWRSICHFRITLVHSTMLPEHLFLLRLPVQTLRVKAPEVSMLKDVKLQSLPGREILALVGATGSGSRPCCRWFRVSSSRPPVPPAFWHPRYRRHVH